MWIPFGCLGFACFAHQELMGLKYSYFVLGLVLTQSEGKKHGTWIQAQPRTLCWVGLCRPRLINLVGLALPIYGPKSYAWAIQCTGPLLDSFLFYIYIYIIISNHEHSLLTQQDNNSAFHQYKTNNCTPFEAFHQGNNVLSS